jgi:hypothetical protein
LQIHRGKEIRSHERTTFNDRHQIIIKTQSHFKRFLKILLTGIKVGCL